MKKTIPSVKVESQTLDNIHAAILKYNKSNLVNLSMQEFRRLALELLSQMILQDKSLPIKLLQK